MSATGYYALSLLLLSLGMVLLLHALRSKITLAPLFALGAIETILVWQLLRIGWWGEIGSLKFNAPLIALLPSLVVSSGLVYMMDGTRAARAFIVTIMAAAAASIGHSEFVRSLGHHIPLPSFFVFSLQQQASLAASIIISSVIVAVSYESLRRIIPSPAAIAAGTGAGTGGFLVSYSFLSYGIDMGWRNLHIESIHYLLASLPAMASALGYAMIALYRQKILPARPVAEVFSIWHALEHEIHTVRQGFLEASATIASLQALNERLEMERRLRDYQMQHSPLAIVELDAAGAVIRHNPAASRLLAGEASMEGRRLDRWLPGLEAMLRREDGFSRVFEVPAGNGTRFVQATVMPIHLQQKVNGYSVIAEDVTMREQAKFRQRVAERVKGIQMTSKVISHDFSNLMLAIEGNLSRIRDALPLPLQGQLEGSLLAIAQAAARGRDMLRQLGSRQPFQLPELRTGELWPLVAEVVRLQMAGSIAAGISLRPDIRPGGIVEIDQTQILRVLMNLVGNAMRATPAGGVITVSLREEGRGVVVEIADSGCGMSADQLASAFEPGFSTKSGGQGGLGLAISYLIIDAHGGRLTLSSAAGQGTTATVWLPAAEATRASLKDIPLLLAICDDAVREDLVQLLSPVTTDLTEVAAPQELLAILSDDPRGWGIVIVGSDFDLPGQAEAALAGTSRITVSVQDCSPSAGDEGVSVSWHPGACSQEAVDWLAGLIRSGSAISSAGNLS